MKITINLFVYLPLDGQEGKVNLNWFLINRSLLCVMITVWNRMSLRVAYFKFTCIWTLMHAYVKDLLQEIENLGITKHKLTLTA